jgi:hypothetical protein
VCHSARGLQDEEAIYYSDDTLIERIKQGSAIHKGVCILALNSVH